MLENVTIYVQYISDIHLEHHSKEYNFLLEKDESSSILVLGGDIGNPKTSKYSNFIKKYNYILFLC